MHFTARPPGAGVVGGLPISSCFLSAWFRDSLCPLPGNEPNNDYLGRFHENILVKSALIILSIFTLLNDFDFGFDIHNIWIHAFVAPSTANPAQTTEYHSVIRESLQKIHILHMEFVHERAQVRGSCAQLIPSFSINICFEDYVRYKKTIEKSRRI